MKVYHNLTDLPAFRNAVLTIGSFDGVHRGHQKILERVIQKAREVEGESIVITFHPHPRLIVYPDQPGPKLLQTIHEKVRMLERRGIDNVVVVPFTEQFSRQSPETYIREFLVGKFHPDCIVIGYDHRFGKERKGDIQLLEQYTSEYNFEIVKIPPQEVEDVTVSSTKIRQALEAGDVGTANHFLAYHYELNGIVVPGEGLGNKLGFPTANLEIQNPNKLIPADGIYAVHAYHEDKRYDGILYIGNRPSIPAVKNKTIEVNLFSFGQDIYGDKLRVEFIERVREDRAFQDLKELTAQMTFDAEQAREILQRYGKEKPETKDDHLPSVAVVILNYNGKEYLETFLPSVLASTYPRCSVVVADNGSTDGSLELFPGEFPEVQVLDLKKNYGFAGGYNEALPQVEADYLVLLNSDVQVSGGWLEPLVGMMERDPKVGACQPKIRDHKARAFFEYAGACGGWMDHLGYPLCRGRIFSVVEKDKGQYDSPQEIFWATGAAMCIRPGIFHSLGGFDADYFAHLEEIDLCWRMKRAGYKVMVEPASVVFHVGGGTLDYLSPRKAYLNFRNSLITLVKNEPGGKLLWLIPLRLILDWVAAGLFLTEGKFRHIWAIVRAHLSLIRQFRRVLQKRKANRELIARVSIAPQPNKNGVLRGSIVWEFFVRRKRTFAAIFDKRGAPTKPIV